MDIHEIGHLQTYADRGTTQFDIRTTVKVAGRQSFSVDVINAAAYSPQRAFRTIVAFGDRTQAERAIDAAIQQAMTG